MFIFGLRNVANALEYNFYAYLTDFPPLCCNFNYATHSFSTFFLLGQSALTIFTVSCAYYQFAFVQCTSKMQPFACAADE